MIRHIDAAWSACVVAASGSPCVVQPARSPQPVTRTAAAEVLHEVVPTIGTVVPARVKAVSARHQR